MESPDDISGVTFAFFYSIVFFPFVFIDYDAFAINNRNATHHLESISLTICLSTCSHAVVFFLRLRNNANEQMLKYACKVFLSISANDREHHRRVVTNYIHTHTSRFLFLFVCVYTLSIHLPSTNEFIKIV